MRRLHLPRLKGTLARYCLYRLGFQSFPQQSQVILHFILELAQNLVVRKLIVQASVVPLMGPLS